MSADAADRRGRQPDRRQGDRRSDSIAGADRTAADPMAWLGSGFANTRPPGTGGEPMAAHEGALVRVYRAYSAARAAVGVGLLGLLAAQSLGGLAGTPRAEWLTLVALLYAAEAIVLWLLPRFGALARPQPTARQRQRQWLATIGVDLAAFMLLHVLEAGASFNYAALLVLPVLMAGVLTGRLLALGTTAAVTLMLLVVAWRAVLVGEATLALLVQSGLAGIGLFAITLLAGELAGRLAREELAARGSLQLARQQAQLNRLVIEEMADGVLVVDRGLCVRAANPAARALLVDQGLSPPAPFTLQQRPGWAALLQAVERAVADGAWPDAGQDVLLAFSQGHTRTLRLRVRFMRSRSADAGRSDRSGDGAAEPVAVLLLEDVRTLQARIRQEKLAAMGRVSAGIAHEIRNPLAAIAQANALLLEDELAPQQRQLAQMVDDNVQRLKRLVDDVMEIAPGAVQAPGAIDAAAIVARAAADWARTAQVAAGRLRAELPSAASGGSGNGALGVLFDAEHLRRVLVNLLDNAHRHASAEPGAIFLRLAARDDTWAVLAVLSDGAPIAPEIERHLFEPFFSTRSRGSGLGLYICRELCERYGASIEYRPRPAAERLRNEFVVSMRRSALAESHGALRLDLRDPA